jgi:uncharacterized protein (DUF58 family)
MRGSFPAVWLSARGVWALLALSFVLAVASVMPWLQAAVVFCAVLFLACVAADARIGPSARTLRIARRALPLVSLRRTAVATYDVENRADIAIRLGILETPLTTVDFAQDGLRAALEPRSQRTLTLDFLARERGRAQFGDLYAWSENRIGLLRRRYRVSAEEEVRVFPDLSAVERYGVLARRNTLLDAGLRRIRSRGLGSNFESLRDYNAGDPFRLVDWKATARRGRLTVAQYDIERSQTVMIALDCGRLMLPRLGAQRKFDYALTAALSVARIAHYASDNVGLLAFAAKPIRSIAPRRGAAHYNALAQSTFDLQPRPEEPDYETIFATLRNRSGKRSLIVLLTDISDPVTSAAVLAGLSLLVPRHLVMCVLMNDAAISDALATVPSTASAAYRTVVAMSLADERAKSVAMLRARGTIVIDVPAPQLSVALMDAYLDVKARGRL